MPVTCAAIAVLLAASLVAAPLAAAPADAKHAPSDRAKVEAYLGQHDVSTAAELRALGSKPDQTLMALVSDEHADGLLRARAAAGLRYFPSPGVETFLSKLIQSKAKTTDGIERLILRRAALSLGWMVGAGAPDTLALLFDNDDVEVRVDAAIGLGLTRADAAIVALRRQLAVESAPRVREQIERQLRSMGQPTSVPEKAPPPKPAVPMRSSW